MSEIKIENLKTKDLIPYARNAKLHNDTQIAAIAGSIKEFGFNNPVLIDNDNGIIAGHGRVMAAQKLKLESIPCIRLGHLNENQKRAYIIADNRLAETGGGWNEELLRLEINEINWQELGEFSLADLGEIFASEEMKTQEAYSRKIKAPIYEPTGEMPSLTELYDRTKTEELQKEIKKAKLDKGLEAFLMAAAERHTVFNFRNVAEYYAHAPKNVQTLFENSALVIIDFDKAIENGFIQMAGQVAQAYLKDFPDETA